MSTRVDAERVVAERPAPDPPQARARPKHFDAALIDRLRPLRRRDNWRNVVYLGVDWGLIAGAIALAERLAGPLAHAAALLVIASRMRALNNLTHEASHRLLFRSPRANEWAGRLLCAFPIAATLGAYRSSHMDHHRLLGDPVYDPDRVRYRELGMDDLPLPRAHVALRFARVLALVEVPRYVRGTVAAFVHAPGSARGELAALWAYWAAVVATATLLGALDLVLLYWLVPYLTVFQVLRYLSEISEHGGLYGNERLVELARNNVTNPVVRVLVYPHADNWHLVHHLVPTVPHYRLRRAHEILLADAEYRDAHHCYGYFLPRIGRPGATTLAEMVLDGRRAY